MIAELLARLLAPRPLSAAEARATFAALLDPTTSDPERAAVLVALEARARYPEELAHFATEMRRRARPFAVPRQDGAVDLCGTGGAPQPSYNVSTVAAVVVAAAGRAVVKHGNRSARGICGSSDLLEALGLPVQTSVAFARATYRKYRIAFLHAPLYHPETAAVGPVRRLLRIPTIFNRLGPLSNPARVPHQVVGAPDAATAETFSSVLVRLGVVRGITMSSTDGSDEFSPRARTIAYVWDGRRKRRLSIDPNRWLPADDRRGGWGPLPAAEAAEEAHRLLAGGGGARRGSVLLTAGAALWTTGTAPTFPTGIERAQEALDDGRAAALLGALQAIGSKFHSGAA